MQNVAPSARYDLPWKAAIAHAPRAFLRFFFPALADQIDWHKRPRFHDKELASIGFGNDPHGMVADQLLEVCQRGNDAPWILIHIEVQAQRATSLPKRVLDYNYRIATEYARPVASLVLLADNDPNWRPQAFHHQLYETVMGISYSIAKLLDHASHKHALLASDNPFALLTLAHLHTQQAHHDADLLYAAKLRLTKLLYQHRWSKGRILTLFKVINWMMALPEQYQTRYWQAVIQFGKEQQMKSKPIIEWVTPLEEMFMDWGRKEGLEKGLEEGRKKGFEEGTELGRREGAATLLERQLEHRFGPLSNTTRNKLTKADIDQLAAWSETLMEAQSLRQVFR
jgi:hypothetical protein